MGTLPSCYGQKMLVALLPLPLTAGEMGLLLQEPWDVLWETGENKVVGKSLPLRFLPGIE